MKSMNAEEFAKDYQYDKAKRDQRKEDRKSRDRRKSGRSIWEAKPADNVED